MVQRYIDSEEIQDLSRLVNESEQSGYYSPDWDTHAGVDGEAHPLVLELNAEHTDGPAAALGYLAEGSETDAGALVRWMIAGGFKGMFKDMGDFACDQFAISIEADAGVYVFDVSIDIDEYRDGE